MDSLLYKNSLGVAITLMLFFAFYFLLAKTPDKPVFDNYKQSRRIMGVALLVLVANYSVHLFAGLRFKNQDWAILMNLSTYFVTYWLFSAALVMLLNRAAVTTRRLVENIAYWLLWNAFAAVLLLALPCGTVRHVCILVLAAWLVIYGISLARRIIRTYHRAEELFDDTHSENIAAYIRWMSIFTWWAVVYGICCGVLTFLPDRYVFLWILSSIPFYIYLYCSYMNYLLFHEKVETILETSAPEEPQIAVVAQELPEGETVVRSDGTPVYYADIEKNLDEWLMQEGFTSPGLTIEDVALMLNTNRTYFSAYIKKTFNMPFREWIADLRIEYAKKLLAANPKLSVGDVCGATGFLSQSYFVKLFTEKEGISPAKWKKLP